MNIPAFYIETYSIDDGEGNIRPSERQVDIILMHFGLTFEVVNGIPAQFTAAICRMENGEVVYLDPRQLIIKG